MKADADIRLAELTHQLQMAAKENELRYNILQEKRADIITETYVELHELLEMLTRYTSFRDTTDSVSLSEQKSLSERIESFKRSFIRRKLYFPKDVAASLEFLFASINFSAIRFRPDSPNPKRANAMEIMEAMSDWLALMHDIESKIKPAMDQLADEMRTLLGSSR